MVGAINKLYGKTWELNGATYENGIFTFPANGFAMANCTMENPIAGHLYYGSVEQKAPSGASFDDGRFEWWKGDAAGELMVFAYMDGTNDQWVRQSAVYQAEADTSGSWIMRNFTVNGTAEAYRRNPIIIDLTAAFGAGNEPTAAWVDANMIPSANNDVIFFDVPSAENAVEDRRRMMLAGGISVSPILEENDWETISKIARSGKASEYWKIGDTKTYTCSGVTYKAQIIGFNHDDVTDSASYGRTKAGITFQNVEIIDRISYVFSGKTQYWDTAYIKTYQFNNFYIPNIPSEMAAAMVAVNKQFKNASSYSSTSMGTCSDTVFLLSYREIFGTTGTITSAAAEGTRYAFYAAGNSRLKKLVNGTADDYSTRSLVGKENNDSYYVFINESGNASTTRVPMRWVPAFCV